MMRHDGHEQELTGCTIVGPLEYSRCTRPAPLLGPLLVHGLRRHLTRVRWKRVRLAVLADTRKAGCRRFVRGEREIEHLETRIHRG